MVQTDTKTQLLDAAQELVQRVGANAMSYQDLSAAVGIRKASIHHHFPTKGDLLVALIDRYSASFLSLVAEIQGTRASGAAKLKRFADLFEATLRQADCAKACPCGMLGAEVATLDRRAHQKLSRFYIRLVDFVTEILQEGCADGTLSLPGKPEDAAWLLFSMLEGVMVIARVEGGVSLFRRVLRQFCAMVEV